MRHVSLGLLFLGQRTPSRVIEVARLCERSGFDYFWVPDERFFREVYSLCALVAMSTERLQVGPCVTDPYTRHPSLTAMAIATLDEISGGRAVLGIGAGVSGFAELGIERRRPASIMREAIALVRLLMTGNRVDFKGEELSFHGRLDFVPPRTEVPVYLAAGGPRMLRLAGETAQGVIVEGCVAPGTLEAAVDQVTRGAESAGRGISSVDIVARIDVAIAGRLEEAYDALRPRIARHVISSAPSFARFTSRGLEIPPVLRELALGATYTHDPAKLRPIAAHVTPEMIDAFCIAATPESISQRLAGLASRGATQIVVNPIAIDDVVEPVIEAVGAWRRAEQGG